MESFKSVLTIKGKTISPEFWHTGIRTLMLLHWLTVWFRIGFDINWKCDIFIASINHQMCHKMFIYHFILRYWSKLLFHILSSLKRLISGYCILQTILGIEIEIYYTYNTNKLLSNAQHCPITPSLLPVSALSVFTLSHTISTR